MERIIELLKSHRLRFGLEQVLQDDVETVLASAGVPFHREYRLGKDRVDFFVDGLAIECKVDGGQTAVLEQCLRYACHDQVKGVLLVTSRRAHRFGLAQLRNKPFSVLWVAGTI